MAKLLRGLSALNRLDLWGFSNFLNGLQLWDFGCLLHDLHPWNLHNRVTNHHVNTLWLWNLHGFLNNLDHRYLSLHSNGHFINPFRELNLRILDVLGKLIDFLPDDFLSTHCLLDDLGSLHLDCIDDVLNIRVR